MARDPRSDDTIVLVSRAKLPTRYGGFQIFSFGGPDHDTHVALVRGRIAGGHDVLVRMHSGCLTGDVFGSRRCDCGEQLDAALRKIGRARRGILLYLSQEGRGIGIANKVAAYHLQDRGLDTVEANEALGFPADARDYRFAASVLRFLGVKSVQLMTNNPRKITGLQRYGIQVVERVALESTPHDNNIDYLRTKREKLGHFFSTLPLIT